MGIARNGDCTGCDVEELLLSINLWLQLNIGVWLSYEGGRSTLPWELLSEALRRCDRCNGISPSALVSEVLCFRSRGGGLSLEGLLK